jgi:hypothetical protein
VGVGAVVSATSIGVDSGAGKYQSWESCPLGDEQRCAGRLFRSATRSAPSPLAKLAGALGLSRGSGAAPASGASPAPLGWFLLQEQARRHVGEGCLYLNEAGRRSQSQSQFWLFRACSPLILNPAPCNLNPKSAL